MSSFRLILFQATISLWPVNVHFLLFATKIRLNQTLCTICSPCKLIKRSLAKHCRNVLNIGMYVLIPLIFGSWFIYEMYTFCRCRIIVSIVFMHPICRVNENGRFYAIWNPACPRLVQNVDICCAMQHGGLVIGMSRFLAQEALTMTHPIRTKP